MIVVKNLYKSFNNNGKINRVLKNINFTLNKNESAIFLGGNGSGKSTLLKLLGGIDLPDSGEIKINHKVSWPIGLTGGFQGSLTGKENCIFLAKLFYNDNIDEINRVVNYVRTFSDIGSQFFNPVKTYSSGTRSKVQFGLAMAMDFDTYLIDEVTSVGDLSFREKSQRVLKEKLKKSGAIFVSHDYKTDYLQFDKAFILDDGNLTVCQDVEDALSRYKRSVLEKI